MAVILVFWRRSDVVLTSTAVNIPVLGFHVSLELVIVAVDTVAPLG